VECGSSDVLCVQHASAAADCVPAHFSSFLLWLPKHAAVIQSLLANIGDAWSYDYADGLSEDVEQHLEQVRQQLQEAMAQLLPSAGSAGATPPPAAAEATAATVQPTLYAACTPHCKQQQQQMLRLASFSSDWLFQPPFLAALPAASLTALDLDLGCSSPQLNVPKWIAALTSLSNLQKLRLSSSHPTKTGYRIPARCLLALPQLSRLTVLTLGGQYWSLKGLPEALQQLLTQPPPLLQQLHLTWLVKPRSLDMRHLTKLTELTLEMGLPDKAVLPAQLQRLTMQIYKPPGPPGRHGEPVYASNVAAVMPLKQLRELILTVNIQEPEVLLPLAVLPVLQRLCLVYNGAKDAAATAAAWLQLPQLRELLLEFFGSPTEQDMVEMLAVITESTGVTKLRMPVTIRMPVPDRDSGEEVHGDRQPAFEWVGYPICSSLASMTHFKNLRIDDAALLVPGDAPALSALTALTRLVLRESSFRNETHVLREAEAAAYAQGLWQLRHLDLGWCEIESVKCLAAIGSLRQLTELRLMSCSLGAAYMIGCGLKCMTGLSRLQRLVLHPEHCKRGGPLADKVKQFWAAVQQQRGFT
jgi:hypothetical protein